MVIFNKSLNVTREVLKTLPGSFTSHIEKNCECVGLMTTDSTSHNCLKRPSQKCLNISPELIFHRGTMPHIPNKDRGETRKSVTIQSNGAPGGPIALLMALSKSKPKYTRKTTKDEFGMKSWLQKKNNSLSLGKPSPNRKLKNDDKNSVREESCKDNWRSKMPRKNTKPW